MPKSSMRSIISLAKFPASIFFSSVQTLSPDISKYMKMKKKKIFIILFMHLNMITKKLLTRTSFSDFTQIKICLSSSKNNSHIISFAERKSILRGVFYP